MTQILYGDRLGREGKIRLGCSAAIINDEGKILLTRRLDNGQWRLPSGGVEAGESPSEAVIREVFEETCLRVRVKRLVGVYSDPNQLVMYADGVKVQIVAIRFEVEVTGGALGLSNETSGFGYFSLKEMEGMEMLGHHKKRIEDTLLRKAEAVFE
ncbi:MAG: NUDIX hydrolase [Anaerolineae bacterium CG03_land_8_20_14_0_80_58_20]|nr:MAG: NUDIX hydrolase [Anaerolineae bacterium CG03_land_8_20_14_0_80_58_20]